MKTNVNLISSFPLTLKRFRDNGKTIPCRVDNFPADNPAYIKRDGFRCNDVSLLDRLSFDSSFDEDLAKIIASRVKENSKLEVSNLSEKQMIDTLRPSYVQTAAEIKEYEERIYQYVSNTADITQDEVDRQLNVNDSTSVNTDTKNENVGTDSNSE